MNKWLERYRESVEGYERCRRNAVHKFIDAFDGTAMSTAGCTDTDIDLDVPSDDECYCCKGTMWWHDLYGNEKCQVCHPKPE